MNDWRDGNSVRLLENGEEFFPRIIEVVVAARHDIYIETFILREDKVGIELCEALCAAARRGVNVEVVVDGFGSEELSSEFLQRTRDAGVAIFRYEPLRRLLGFRTNLFRRMHRKIVVLPTSFTPTSTRWRRTSMSRSATRWWLVIFSREIRCQT